MDIWNFYFHNSFSKRCLEIVRDVFLAFTKEMVRVLVVNEGDLTEGCDNFRQNLERCVYDASLMINPDSPVLETFIKNKLKPYSEKVCVESMAAFVQVFFIT